MTKRYKICVSGSAASYSRKAMQAAKIVGEEIARRGHILVTGATVGVPFAAAKAAKAAGGIVIGFSPAGSEQEHIKRFRLPESRHFSYVIYTKSGYTGRNLLMVRSCDATITIAGRVGTLNEFTCAFEEDEVVGVLMGTGGVAEIIPEILKAAKKGLRKAFFESDPKKMVEETIKRIRKDLRSPRKLRPEEE